MTEHDLIQMIRDKFAAPEYATFFHVRNGTGYTRAVRTADAVSMSLYPSRGLHLNGFEVKVSQSDWKRELKDPDKAESICRFCDYWWIVAPDEVVPINDLPPTWGLLVPNATNLKIVVKAQKLNPAAMDMPFICSLLRCANEQSADTHALKAATDAGYRSGFVKGKASMETISSHLRNKVEELEERIQSFESESGVSIRSWNRGDVSRALRFVLDGGIESQQNSMENMAEKADQIALAIRRILKKSEVSA